MFKIIRLSSSNVQTYSLRTIHYAWCCWNVSECASVQLLQI